MVSRAQRLKLHIAVVFVSQSIMSGIKRKIEDKDPDYEDISQVQENKRHKVVEQNGKTGSSTTHAIVLLKPSCTCALRLYGQLLVHSIFRLMLTCDIAHTVCFFILFSNLPAREATVQKIEAIIKDQFSLEMKNKEHEIEVIGQVTVNLIC